MDLGKHFILALDSHKITEADKKLLSLVKPAGVFIDADNFNFSANYPDYVEEFRRLVLSAQEFIGRQKIIVALDHEGGRVHRLPKPFTRVPYAGEYANYSELVGEIHAKELSSLGINLVFGPVCDVNTSFENPVIGPRAFSSNPEAVVTSVKNYIKALGQIRYALKHFPGHGDTKQDSHLDFPALEHDLDKLRAREIFPFEKLIQELDVPAVMTAHVMFKAFDREYPATLSEKLINNFLRTELNFQGVVVTDDLDMRAIKDNFSEEEISYRSILAGCDLLLFNHQPERAVGFIANLEKAIADKKISEDCIMESQARIDTFLKSLKDISIYPLEKEVFKKHSEKLRKQADLSLEAEPQKLEPPSVEPKLRVGVILEEDAKTEINFKVERGAKACTSDDKSYQLLPEKTYKLSIVDNRLFLHLDNPVEIKGSLKVTPEENSNSVVDNIVAGRHFHWKKEISQTFPGELEFITAGEFIVLVNIIAFEYYVTCVVASEMSGENCPDEFAKAQAIAAKSWAWVFLNNKYPGKPYTICNDDMSQRYQGSTHLSEELKKVISESAGEFLVDDAGVVGAGYYSKSTGGHGELPENVFGFVLPGIGSEFDCPSEKQPSLDLRKDKDFNDWLNISSDYQVYCSPEVVPEGELGKYLGAVDTEQKYYRWQHVTSAKTIIKNLNEKFHIDDVDNIVDLIPGERGVSGRYLEITVGYLNSAKQEQEFVLKNQYNIRAALHESFLYSSAFKFDLSKDTEGNILEVSFHGAGWGHGVGLCQIGALGMSLLGKNHKEILKHYYPGYTVKKYY